MNELLNDVLETVKTLPGVTRSEVVDLLHPTHKRMAVGMALTTLTRKGKLKVVEKPNPKRHGRRIVQAFEPKHDTIPRRKATVPEYQRLLREVEELRAWKVEAIKRFPDLAVPPIVLKARQIVADEVDNGLRDDVLTGRKDDGPLVRAVIKALEMSA